jgi:L-asparaginase
VKQIETRVELLAAYTGMSDRLVRAALEGGARGLAVIAFGRGNVPPAIVPALKSAADAGVIVTVSSRSLAGRVSARYGYEGGGLQLRDNGAILAGDLSGAKARLLTMVALGMTTDPATARELIRAAL